MKRAIAAAVALGAVAVSGPANAQVGIAHGEETKVFGPNGLIDSLYVTVQARHHTYAIIANTKAYMFRQRDDGTLTDARLILTAGQPGSADQCGVHPADTIVKLSKTHWYGFYHAERANPDLGGECSMVDTSAGEVVRHTRWTVRRLVTRDGGQTWHKGGAVLTQDSALLNANGSWSSRTDDAGSPHVVVSGAYLYMLYTSTDRSSGADKHEYIARAPLSSGGVAGSWHKQLNGSWSQPGIGGQASPLDGLPQAARGVTWNTYLHRWVDVSVRIEGATLYTSKDLLHWTVLGSVFTTGLTHSGWHQACDPAIGVPRVLGYGTTIGLHGSPSTTGQHFWLYFMDKPEGRCFNNGRYLERMKVNLS